MKAHDSPHSSDMDEDDEIQRVRYAGVKEQEFADVNEYMHRNGLVDDPNFYTDNDSIQRESKRHQDSNLFPVTPLFYFSKKSQSPGRELHTNQKYNDSMGKRGRSTLGKKESKGLDEARRSRSSYHSPPKWGPLGVIRESSRGKRNNKSRLMN